ncbi:hypothetical protein [Microbulbifer discodermiae]|uniref:hypothetical protein n=1 Tax=Microbulbifer sp. 2201CG32-9 TaxID=3232309 RepID=UPI00345BAB2F
MTKPTFEIEAAVKALREGKSLSGKDGILTFTGVLISNPAWRGYLISAIANTGQQIRLRPLC